MSDNIIQFRELRLQRASRGVKVPTCKHLQMTYTMDGTITCRTCDVMIAPFRAFLMLVENFRDAQDQLKNSRADYEMLRKEHRHLQATRELDRAWRSRSMVPICPHCDEGIFPDDGFGGSQINKKIALAQRARRKAERDHKEIPE